MVRSRIYWPLSGVILKVRGSGTDLAEVGAIIGQKLPATDQFAVQGRLTGSAKVVIPASRHRAVQSRGSLNLTLNGGIEAVAGSQGHKFHAQGLPVRSWRKSGPLVGTRAARAGAF